MKMETTCVVPLREVNDKKAQATSSSSDTSSSDSSSSEEEVETKSEPAKVHASADDFKSLLDACVDGRLDEVRSLLDLDGININDGSQGGTPLLAASQSGHIDIAKVLIQAGANVNQADTKYGCSPLYIAPTMLNKLLISI